MRKVRGVKALVDYLKSINCPIGQSTIYGLIRTNKIPYNRPTQGVLIFDLDDIDKWLGGEPK